MTTATENKLEKVSAETLAHADRLQPGLKFDAEGASHVSDDDIAKALEAEGLTLEGAKQYQRGLLRIADGLTLATGRAGTDFLGKNKDVDRVSVTAKIGSDHITSEFSRSAQLRNPGTGETFTKYGIASTKLASGIGAKRGEYKRIQEHLADSAASVFGQ